MDGVLNVLSLFSLLLLLPFPSYALSLCTSLRVPTGVKEGLAFCPYNGQVCCNTAEDLQLRKRFDAMNISDSACAAVVKSIVCAGMAGNMFRSLGFNTKLPILE